MSLRTAKRADGGVAWLGGVFNEHATTNAVDTLLCHNYNDACVSPSSNVRCSYCGWIRTHTLMMMMTSSLMDARIAANYLLGTRQVLASHVSVLIIERLKCVARMENLYCTYCIYFHLFYFPSVPWTCAFGFD